MAIQFAPGYDASDPFGLKQINNALQQLMQQQAMREQLNMERERLKIDKDRAKLEMEQAEAKNQGALALMQSDPNMARFVGGGGAPSTIAPQMPPMRAPQQPGPQIASASPMAVGPTQSPVPQIAMPQAPGRGQLPGAPLAPVANGGRGISAAQAGAMLPQIQEYLKTQASLAESGARTEQAKAATAGEVVRTDLARFELRNAPELFRLRTQEIESQVEANRAGASASRAQAAAATTNAQTNRQQLQLQLRGAAVESANAKNKQYTDLAAQYGPRAAARLVYGTTTRPTQEALIAEEMRLLGATLGAANNPQELATMRRDMMRNQIVERLQLNPQLADVIDRSLELYKGDGARAFRDALNAGNLSDDDKAAIGIYIQTLTGSKIDTSRLNRSTLRTFIDSLATTPLTSGAIPTTRNGMPATGFAP